MNRFLKGLLALTVALAFTARGAAAYCPPKPAEHDCCGKSAPAAPKTPCQEMSCCRLAPAGAVPASQVHDLVFLVPVDPLWAASFVASRFVPANSDSGPPGPRALSVSDRSPPALLG